MLWPCETRTSTCRSFATISSGLYRFLAIASSWMSKTYLKSDHFNGGGSLTTLKDKLIKIGAKVVSHGRYVIFQMAEVAIARQMFQEILRLIAELRPQPPPALA